MKLKSTKLFLISMLVFAFPTSDKAESVKYAYDSAGNRIKREIVMDSQKVPKDRTSSPESYSEMLSEREIKIYPNPTDGILRIGVVGYEESDRCTVNIFNLSGYQVITINPSSSLTDIDISSQPNGIYILVISLNGKDTTWKIIKQ